MSTFEKSSSGACKIIWIAFYTLSEDIWVMSSVVLSGMSRSRSKMFSNLYQGFMSPNPFAILAYSDVGLFIPTADTGLFAPFLFWNFKFAGYLICQSLSSWSHLARPSIFLTSSGGIKLVIIVVFNLSWLSNSKIVSYMSCFSL